MERVSKDITAQNQFSDAMQVFGTCLFLTKDTSSMIMTATLQVSMDGSTWFSTGTTLTATGVAYLAEGCGLWYRVGVATGDFTSGTATVYLVKPGRIN
ncbi:MAG: hypothetical protein KAS32_01130 [Candidatus Peribacteraceae bacterium]|nr:hypothetical protein [Candidatus Peribacteraceae bacterium]